MVSINILSWNRPRLLKLTLESLLHSLRNCAVKTEIIILDQGSGGFTQAILDGYENKVDKIIRLNKNIGIASGWNKLYKYSYGDFILPIENDWFCDAVTGVWLEDAIRVLNHDERISFIKLRSLIDHDDYGHGLIEHSPWSLQSEEGSKRYEIQSHDSGLQFYCATPKNISFTFNPVLMPRKFRDFIGQFYCDDPCNMTPLRSGEDRPSEVWREQKGCLGATLIDGPFRHTGFHQRTTQLLNLPIYIGKYMLRKLLTK